MSWSRLNAGMMLVRLCAADTNVSAEIKNKLDTNFLSPPQKMAIEKMWSLYDNGYLELPENILLSLCENFDDRPMFKALSRISTDQRLKDMILRFENDVDEFIESI